MTQFSKFVGMVAFGAATLTTIACGGGSSSSGGGGGGNNGPQITLISPSMVMSDIAIAEFTVVGSGFNQVSQVLIDGKAPAFAITLEDSEHITVNLPGPPPVGVHQITVQNGSQVSNSLSFTYYAPVPAPTKFFNTAPGYFAGLEISPLFLPVGDFNGDGKDDVIIAIPAINGNGDKYASALLLGQSDGSLSGPQYLSNVSGAVAGDVDGNGTIDLVGFSAGTNGSDCFVYLNDGSANFTQGPQCPGVNAGGLIARLVDVNGDGLPDLIVGGQYAPLFVSLNLGGAQFGQAITVATLGLNPSFTIADFNGDGLPDIAYNGVNASTGADQVHILINQGSGIFSDTMPASLQGVGGTVIAADFNVDGIADLAVELTTALPPLNIQVFLGQGNNTFTLASETVLPQTTLAPYTFVTGDFDHDGFPDLAGENVQTQPSQVLYLWGNGKGELTPQFVNGPGGFFLETGDINGDGLPDIVVPDRTNIISVVLGRTDRNFPSPPLLESAPGPYISTADVNGDGFSDIMVGNSIFLNTGNNTFNPAVVVTNNTWAIADLNGDGLADMVGGSGLDVLVWPGTGNPNFPGSPITYTPPSPLSITDLQIVDMDHDGNLDLLSFGIILYSDKQYNFTPVLVPFTDPYIIGDFNGDGYLDIVTDGQTWLGGPNRTFTSMTNHIGLGEPGFTGQVGVVADFNGDGHLDIATTGGTLWYGTGTGDFYMQGGITAEQSLFGLVVGDFNHDGLPDLAGAMVLSQQIVVFINDGKGGFERSFYASGAQGTNLAGGDFNNDGKTDLVVSNFVHIPSTPNALVIFGK